MAELQTKYLLLNGSIVLLMGLLSGAPMGLAIIRKKGEGTVRVWRVAHSTLIMDGLIMIVAGLVVPGLPVDELALWVLVWSLIPSAYGFVLALIIGAWIGCRGLTPKPYGINTVLFGGHTIGALGSLIGVAILTWGFFKAF
jgi:hypothetical protein